MVCRRSLRRRLWWRVYYGRAGAASSGGGQRWGDRAWSSVFYVCTLLSVWSVGRARGVVALLYAGVCQVSVGGMCLSVSVPVALPSLHVCIACVHVGDARELLSCSLRAPDVNDGSVSVSAGAVRAGRVHATRRARRRGRREVGAPEVATRELQSAVARVWPACREPR